LLGTPRAQRLACAMEIETTEGALRAAAELLFAVSRAIDGRGPQFVGGWYKLSLRDDSGYAWLRLIGDRARQYPKQSIHVVVFPHPEFRQDARLRTGRDWWGKEDRHLVVPAGDSCQLAAAVEIVARACWIAHQRAA
jgi:hypothetical protein